MRLKKIDDKALLPRYSTEGSSGFDLFAPRDVVWEKEMVSVVIDEPQLGNKNIVKSTKFEFVKAYTALIPTGWAFEVPHNYGMFILSRSGQGFKHLTHLANCVGLLDFDYRKQCMVKLVCLKSVPPEIKRGDAVAQAVILETPRMFFEVVQELSEPVSEHIGFGSTDKAKK